MRVVLRTGPSVDVDVLLGEAREAVVCVDPNLALADFNTLRSMLRDSVEQFEALGRS
jgi:hypothetical protein